MPYGASYWLVNRRGKGVFSPPQKAKPPRSAADESFLQQVSAASTPKTPGPGMLAMKASRDEVSFRLLLENDDDQTAAMRRYLTATKVRIAPRRSWSRLLTCRCRIVKSSGRPGTDAVGWPLLNRRSREGSQQSLRKKTW